MVVVVMIVISFIGSSVEVFQINPPISVFSSSFFQLIDRFTERDFQKWETDVTMYTITAMVYKITKDLNP